MHLNASFSFLRVSTPPEGTMARFDMSKLFYKFASDERGSTAIEYGLIAALIVIAVIGGITAVGQASILTLSNIAIHL